jgi:4-amino-4-deoxy-L-arabinose transferase-like glycosyltransferase
MSKLTTSEARVARYSLLVVIAAFIALSLVYSLAIPLFEGPDEIWHYAFANHLASGGGLPVFDANQPATFLRNGAHPPLYYALIATLIAPIDRSDFPAEYRFNLASPRITQGATGTSPNLLIHTAREDFPFHNTALAGHLARLVSIALGTLTVIGVFFVARRLLRDERLALIATALVAFIPQFVYGTALVNNDALAAALATWLLYALLRLMDDGCRRWAVLSGVLLGVTLLSKIGMIAVLPVPALALLLMWWQSRKRGSHITHYALLGLAIYVVAVLTAGWWYARNFILYGDPLMWREWQVLTGTGRVPPTPIDFLRDMLGFFDLFWADFSLRVDRVLWPIFGTIVIATIIGLVRRAIKRQWPALDWPGLLVALAWLGMSIATAVRYSFNIYDIHGRLLYPALSTIGVMLALGLSGWPKPKRVPGIALAIIMLIAVLAPFVIIQPAYARPIVSALPEGVTKTSIKYGVVELLGYRLSSKRIERGDTLHVETYWRRLPTTSVISNTYGTAVLSEGQGHILAHIEKMLGTDAYPIWAWKPDDLVMTKFDLPAEIGVTSLVNLDMNMRVEASGFPLTEMDRTTARLDRVVIKHDQPCQTSQSLNVTFGNTIKLIGYQTDEFPLGYSAAGPEGIESKVTLCWQALASVPVDYTVFVHARDEQGMEWIADAQPRGGAYPTSAWAVGDQIVDQHSGIIGRIKHLSVGLYRPDTGERLPIDGTNTTEFELTK